MNIARSGKNKILVTVDSNVYDINVIHKCFYWYGDRFDVDIQMMSEEILITLEGKKEVISDAYWETVSSRIRRDILDFKTRDVVTRETQNVRDLIIAKAFAFSDELDSAPPGEVSDPVGFDPN
jgi:His-Xaa-Ser system protein HxsD